MLLAELRKKVRPFRCGGCGADADPRGVVEVEDALTSYVFGGLRRIPAQSGLIPVLRHAGISTVDHDELDVSLWPSDAVELLGVGSATRSCRAVEPDVLVANGHLLVCIEVKLGAALGSDPLQLPKQVLSTARQAQDRQWWLLCITADRVEPEIPAFEASSGCLAVAGRARVADAVASYFSAVQALDPSLCSLLPNDVRSRVVWLSWQTVAEVLGQVETAHSWEKTALKDIVELLRHKGLSPPRFHGWARAKCSAMATFPSTWSGRGAQPWRNLRGTIGESRVNVWSRQARPRITTGREQLGEPWRGLGTARLPLVYPSVWKGI